MNMKNNIYVFVCVIITSFVYAGEVHRAKNNESASHFNEGNVDFESKRKKSVDLVERGMNYLMANDVDKAFNAFSHSRDYVEGELYLFVYDVQGVCLAHGQQAQLIWKNLWDLQDSYGVPIVQNIINKAKDGGGWITYGWRNATKVSYVKKVVKDGKVYAIGTGYYPHSKEDSVVSLVKGASALFDEQMKSGNSADNVFALISYPRGQFVLGDLYLYALDFKGKIVAQGDRPGLIGSNAWDYQDSKGLKVNQEIIKKLKESDEGIWIKYRSKKTEKHAYAQKVTDTKGNQYFIACGFYPDAGRKQAIDLVRQGFRFMKANGLSLSVETFNDKRNNQFLYGDLYLEVYTLDGKCVAHGNNLDLVGKNFWDVADQDGKFYVRSMIQKAQNEPGWVDYKLSNLFRSTYVEKIDLGTESYVIACGLYPISKRETTILLVKTASDYLRSNPRQQVFREFVLRNGKFIRGDLTIFAFDFSGLCFAYGDDYNLIWKNLINIKDEDGKAFVRLFVNTVKSGPGQVSFRLNNARKIGYVEPVEKDGKSYVVGSSYYL
ncbi:MAG: cache domain-containing protein [Candidatus Dependentiae bacterium]